MQVTLIGRSANASAVPAGTKQGYAGQERQEGAERPSCAHWVKWAESSSGATRQMADLGAGYLKELEGTTAQDVRQLSKAAL